MFIKLLVGPAASGKSTYIENHKAEDDIIGFTIIDKVYPISFHIEEIQKGLSNMTTQHLTNINETKPAADLTHLKNRGVNSIDNIEKNLCC